MIIDIKKITVRPVNKKPNYVLIMFLFMAFTLLFYGIAMASSQPTIEGETGILMDATTGQILWEKNAHEQKFPASTTKILTAILVLEKGSLQETTIASRNARNQIGSSLYLDEGEEIIVRDLIYGVMLRSGNDAAVAAAEYVSGSVEEFSELMNKRARELGAQNSNFVNPSGLHDDNHYSTAYDLAIISKYAMTIPEFREIVGTSSTHIPWPAEQWDRRLDNGNRLLTRYPGANGIKTGYTTRAKGTLVASANRDGMELIAVTLSSGRTFDDAISLFDYGFDNYEKKLILSSNQIVTHAPVRFGQNVPLLNIGEAYYTLLKGSAMEVKITPVLKELVAPVNEGVLAGTVEVSVNGKLVSILPLVTANQVPRKINTHWWFYGVIILAVFIPFRIHIALKRRRKANRLYRKRRYFDQSF